MPRIKKFQLDAYLKKRKKRKLKAGSFAQFQLDSAVLNNSRLIDVYLPPSYKPKGRKRYPVIYMHDGNNLFFPEIAFGGWPWAVDRCVNTLSTYGMIQEPIVVGVHNTWGRHFEYSWTPMSFQGQVEGGGGTMYAHMLIQELMPQINARFRTLPGRENTAIMGSSMGGLISYYLGLYHPEVFGKIGVVSPSFWWNHGEPIRDAHQMSPHNQIWMCMGTREGNPKEPVSKNMNIALVRQCRDALLQNGFYEGHNLAYLEDRGAYHTEYFWGKRLYLPLIYFFGKSQGLIWKK